MMSSREMDLWILIARARNRIMYRPYFDPHVCREYSGVLLVSRTSASLVEVLTLRRRQLSPTLSFVPTCNVC